MYHKGFTLIEMIIVIVIIAVMSAVVTLNVGAPNYSRFMAGVEQLSSTMSILSDEAIFTSSVISCDIDQTSLSCNKYRDGEWTELQLRRLVSWGWPTGFKITRVTVNGVPLKDKQPIRFLPSGDNGGISIEVTNGEFSAWIDSDLSGRFKVAN